MTPGNRIAVIDNCRRDRDWKGLVAFLSDPDKGIRRRAARALGEIGDPDALPALMEATTDRDAWVRLDVIRSLGRLRAAIALNVLIEALNDENIDIRMETLHTLGCTRDKRAAGPLVRALEDPHQEIRSGAAVALEQIGWTPADTRERALHLMAKKQWADLLLLGGYTVESAWDLLNKREEYVRVHAIEALGQTRDDRVAKILLRGMGDPSRAVRLSAMGAFVRLPSFDPDRCIRALIQGDETGQDP